MYIQNVLPVNNVFVLHHIYILLNYRLEDYDYNPASRTIGFQVDRIKGADLGEGKVRLTAYHKKSGKVDSNVKNLQFLLNVQSRIVSANNFYIFIACLFSRIFLFKGAESIPIIMLSQNV